MRNKILKFVLIFQGLYYSIVGLWVIVSLDSFSRITNHYGDAFDTHAFAALVLVLGLFFIYSATKENLQRPIGFLALGIAIAIIIPEIIYLPQIGNPILFWLDFVEELLIVGILSFLLFRQ